MVSAITLTGDTGSSLRLDCMNQSGPTDAWATFDTVTLTNTWQLHFDTSAPDHPSVDGGGEADAIGRSGS